MSRVRYYDLAGHISILGGANAGIGRAIVETLHEQGVITVAADLAEQSGRAEEHYLALDATDEEQVARLCDKVAEQFGGPDVWIHNAGHLRRAPTLELKRSAWERALAVNLTSALLGAQNAADHMMRNRSGTIINLSSYAGMKAHPNCADYASAKAGVAHLTSCLALEMGSVWYP